ncbi:MAG: formylglycine-generating enzyme family protein, partial [Opitutaceae bacterium]|nr:formylglycine-generating enzyme family protein [Opitutaceae bacterium]
MHRNINYRPQPVAKQCAALITTIVSIVVLFLSGCGRGQDEYAKIARDSSGDSTGVEAVLKITDHKLLADLSRNASAKNIRRAAMEKLFESLQNSKTVNKLGLIPLRDAKKPFFLGKYEVTQAQWKEVMGTNVKECFNNAFYSNEKLEWLDGKTFKEWVLGFGKPIDEVRSKLLGNVGANYPMTWVSWNDAMAFCKKLTEVERAAGRLPEGYEYTLPTEKQWEYACRAGS